MSLHSSRRPFASTDRTSWEITRLNDWLLKYMTWIDSDRPINPSIRLIDWMEVSFTFHTVTVFKIHFIGFLSAFFLFSLDCVFSFSSFLSYVKSYLRCIFGLSCWLLHCDGSLAKVVYPFQHRKLGSPPIEPSQPPRPHWNGLPGTAPIDSRRGIVIPMPGKTSQRPKTRT